MIRERTKRKTCCVVRQIFRFAHDAGVIELPPPSARWI